MLRLPQSSASPKVPRIPVERQPLRVPKASQPTHAISCNGKLPTGAKNQAAPSAARVPALFQGGIGCKKGGDLNAAPSSLRSSPSTDRSTSSSSPKNQAAPSAATVPALFQGGIGCKKGGDLNAAPSSLRSSPSTDRSTSSSSSSSKNYYSRFESQQLEYPQSSSLLDVSEAQGKVLQRDRLEEHEGQQDAGLPHSQMQQNSSSGCCSSISSSSGGGSSGCICIGGSTEGMGRSNYRLQAHACPPLSLMYLRLGEAPQLTQEVERKLRALIGFVDSNASLQKQQRQTEYTVAVVLYIQRPKAFGFLSSSPQRQQHQQQQQQQQQHFKECLRREMKQQQEVEKAIRRVLFAIVDMATARQFHLPPPSVSHHLYGYDIVLSSNQAPLLGDWALQLPQGVRLL
ncbi:hypothetical protein, conserved [Eimeria praecox]|uniref:Uncharacterized protein n=1 Tax=Eimeria praecox TaxID=51316 RepID=U6GAJ9_9EIME|nr:hypothetical protein, conserved [Eimeria praecox]